MSQGVTQSESIATPSETRPILSVVCVFNNRTVRQQCLDRSLRALEDRGQLIDYVPVDNTSGEFTTAGAALNDGARHARGQVITFAHQDVYVHSASRLQSAARLLVSGDWHLVGACGVSMNTPNIGKMRDRVVLDGVHTDLPLPVQTLDEVFVMALRDTVIEHPFSEDPTVAWHGYTVEYSLRLQSLGLRVGAMTLDITHNSLSTNMTGLDVAHRAIGRMFPSCTPIQTTCGEIHRWPVRRTLERLSRAKRPLHRWLKQSAQAWRIRRVVNGSQCVLSDIREDIDHLLALADGPIDVVNIDDDCVVDADLAAPLTLSRRDRVMTVRTETDLGQRSRDDRPRPANGCNQPPNALPYWGCARPRLVPSSSSAGIPLWTAVAPHGFGQPQDRGSVGRRTSYTRRNGPAWQTSSRASIDAVGLNE